jgi:hypothetical protein
MSVSSRASEWELCDFVRAVDADPESEIAVFVSWREDSDEVMAEEFEWEA